ALAGGAAQAHGQATGALQAPLAVLTGERQQSEAGSIALLGVGLGTQHVLNDRPGVRADRLAPLDESPWRPLRVRAMRLGHVFGDRRVGTALVRAHMGGDTLAAEEDLNRRSGIARPHRMTDQGVRNAVV